MGGWAWLRNSDTALDSKRQSGRVVQQVSGRLAADFVRALSPGVFVDVFIRMIALAARRPILALLPVSFSSPDLSAEIRWRLTLDGKSGAGRVIGGPWSETVTVAGELRRLMLYGQSLPVATGVHTIRAQVGASRAATIRVRPLTAPGEALGLSLLELG